MARVPLWALQGSGGGGQWALLGFVFVAQGGHLPIISGSQKLNRVEDQWVEDIMDTLAQEGGASIWQWCNTQNLKAEAQRAGGLNRVKS